MKLSIIISLLLLLCFTGSSEAQRVKIVAYQQPLLQGKKTVQPTNQRFHYRTFVYSKKAVVVTAIWIKGESFHFKTNLVSSKPVIYLPQGSEQVVLVGPTSKQVTEVTVTPLQQEQESATSDKLKNALKSNEIVITYLHRNKLRIAVLKKMKVLEPVPLK